MLIRLDNCHSPIPDITVLKQYLTEIENDCQPADIIADIVQNDNYLQNKDLYLLPLGGLFECDFGIGVISCNNVVYDFWDKLNERLEKEGFKECDIVKYTNLIQRIIYSIKDCLSGLKSDFVHIGIMKNANNKVFLPKKLDNDKAKSILQQIILNDELAFKENIPMCQDTGITIVFVEIGNEVFINGDIYEAINNGVKEGYINGYLRKSVVKSPLNRINTQDNTPAIIHIKHTLGDKLKITVCPKGAGSENMSKVKMLVPADGINGIKKFVIDTIVEAGGRACPPLVVGVGIGGDLEKSALIAKEALTRPIDDESEDLDAKKLEHELFEEINNLDIGPMGLHGKTTCLAVKVNLFPCHIASLPVAVNLQCHASRHKVVIL